MDEPRVRRRAAKAPRHHGPSLDPIPRRLANPWPPLEVLSEDALQRIMDAAYRILEEAGLEFRSARALDILARNGAVVERSTQIVRFDRDLVKHFCGLAPRIFSLHSRNPENEVVFGGNIINFSSANGMPNASDLDRGRRYGDYKTLCDLISLNNALGVIHLSGGEVVEPMDIAVHLRPAKMIYAHIRYGDLVWAARGIGRQPVLDAVEMARISRGISLEELAAKPSFYVITNTNSPRRIDEELLEGAMLAAEYGQAVCVTPFTLAGAMAPITLAGALALQTAEAIAVPGAPAIYGGFTSNVDMRTGSPAFGTPEYVRATIAGGQIARHLGLPYRTSSVNSSCAVDAQAVYETSFALFAAVMSHGNFINHATGWLEGGLINSFEKIIIDAEMLRGWAASLQPIDVSDEDLAVEAVKEVAPGSHFFASSHTLTRFETAFYRPLISDWRNYETWKEAGSRTATERAHDLWPKILKAYVPPALDPAINDELRAYIARRTAEPAS
jgi:trimethylamine--corrinoid protein Co-methyltransferase